jgi:tetratricopeptide (TPR) repeat protein
LDHNHPDLALNLTNIGAIYSKKNEHEAALDYYHRVLEIRLSTLGENHDKTALSMVNYGSVLVKLHRETEAKAYFQRAIPVYSRVFGEDHEKTIKLQKKLEKLG